MPNQKRHLIPDPIAGTIEFPTWLTRINDEPAIKRMMFIRQLGLKAYIDFPGAIHTRYSHALGTMHLADKVVSLLIQKMQDKGEKAKTFEDNLKANKPALIAAGFLHDIAHGPFSHSVDFAMRKITGKSHQNLAEDIIKKELPSDLSNWVDVDQVLKLIRGKHDYPFLSEIIDGPIDVDKIDYLLRDAYHVGLRYSFDISYFLSSYTILGDQNALKTCKLGLENTQQAIATTEIFLVIWKNMYDLVYHIESSRIAEKMLEKAVLMNKDNHEITEAFTKSFLELDDQKLLDKLSSCNSKTNNLIKSITKQSGLYKIISPPLELDQQHFSMDTKFLTSLKDEDEVSESLTRKLNEELHQEDYSFICDIVTSKAPRQIQIDELDESEGEFWPLHKKSKIVGAIQSLRQIRVYINPSLSTEFNKETIYSKIKNIIEG